MFYNSVPCLHKRLGYNVMQQIDEEANENQQCSMYMLIYIHYTFYTQKKPRYPPWKKLINQTAWRGRLASLRVTSKYLLVNAPPTLISKNMYLFLPASSNSSKKKPPFQCVRAIFSAFAPAPPL